jgi:hypothetical protein
MRADPRKAHVRAYVATGESDANDWRAWPGQNVMESAQAHHAALIDALVVEVRRRTLRRELPPEPMIDWSTDVRSRLEPMVRGLVPTTVQDAALAKLVPGVTLVTPGTIEGVLRRISGLSTAWSVANLYLDAVGATPLDPDGWAPLGLAAGHECYVSFHDLTKRARFDDFVVHEAAHVLNDLKWRDVGLIRPRRGEWLLGIWSRHRELFAYSCERWSRVLALGATPRARRSLVDEIARDGPFPNDDTVDRNEYVDVLRDAAAARNGWKRLLARCQEPKPTRPPGDPGPAPLPKAGSRASLPVALPE